MRRLHIGCGTIKLPGFVNIDIREEVEPDIVDDIVTLARQPDDSADLIYACHVLQHLPKPDVPKALASCRRVLKGGGILRLSVPDFDAIVEEYARNEDLDGLQGLLYARQDYPGNVNRQCWNFSTLSGILERAGFRNARKWYWQEVDHGHVDDYSQAYLPHMDKENGQLMSLNVEAVK